MHDVECTAFEFFKLGRYPAEAHYKVTEHDDTISYCIVDKDGNKTWYTPYEYDRYWENESLNAMWERNLAFEFDEEDEDV